MASEIKVRLRRNRQTGQTDIYIGMESEEDWLPHEHERKHRDIVENLLGKGILDPDKVGEVLVERIPPIRDQEPPQTHKEPESSSTPVQEPQAVKQ